MKKEYIKPSLSVEVIDVELPISASPMDVYGKSEGTIDGDKNAFLTKDRDNSDWGGLW